MKNRLIKIFAVLILIPFIGCAQTSDENNMTVKELQQQMETDSSLVVLDVRTVPELSGPLGKIDGIINIPVQELDRRMSELDEYKDQPIAVICRSGNRSVIATNMLKKNGFNAKNVLGGMKAWNREIK